MKIGFYFESFKGEGGVYQVALNYLEALREIPNHECIIFNISPDFPYEKFSSVKNWKIIDLVKHPPQSTLPEDAIVKSIRRKQLVKRKLILIFLDVLRFFRLYKLENFLARFKAKKRARVFNNYDLDLLLFHGTSELSLYTKIPTIVMIHDINHRLHPEFPEMSQKGQWSKREYVFSRIGKNTYRISVPSETGKADTLRLYNIAPNKIVILRPLPPPYLRTDLSTSELQKVTRKYNLPEKFLFYPAQFWPHKNHYNLVSAVKILKDKGTIVPLVFVGSRKELWGEYDRVVDLVKKSGLDKQIFFLGYVPIEDMSPLYRLATGLVMPAHAGWTFLPIVEAWAMGCPIIYSRTPCSIEQGGDSAIYVDPYRPDDIALKIEQLWENPELRNRLVQNGKKRLAAWTQLDFNKTVKKFVDDFEKEKYRRN
ncbi:MAG: glycosyltransferase family 1 protein [Patescibacteria group bacterium]|mgnify:CR=1 FL=1